MLKYAGTLPQFEQDLVKGYCRLNCYGWYIPDVVKKLSMLYLWILDEFILANEEYKDLVRVTGLNNTILECIGNGLISSSVLGKNIISAAHNYHHWRFQIVNDGSTSIHDEYNFMIGIKPLDENIAYSLIGSHGLKSHGLSEFYTKNRFMKNNDILDMFLDLKSGELSYIVNNHRLGVAYSNLDINKEYRMHCSLSNKGSILELVSYDSSKGNCNTTDDLFEYIKYIRSIPNIDEKIKHYEIIIGLYEVNVNDILNDYIDCLIAKECFDKVYSFIFNENTIGIKASNICTIGSYFYFEDNDFEKALNVLQLISNDDILVSNHLCVELAFCYEHSKKEEHYVLALKYYLLALEYEDKLEETGRNECLHHMGAIYFNYIYDYKSALDCFLKLGDAQINNRDLESAIASCYDHLKDYNLALKYFKKYESKYKDKASVIIAIALIYFKCDNHKKAEKYFHRALKSDKTASNWMIHSKYGYFLLNGKKDYKLALFYFEKSLKIANNIRQRTESFKCIGATYDKLGDMINAIKYTQKVLDINPNDADALNNAGYFFLTMKNYETAYIHLSKSLDIYPSGELTNGNIGICLYEMKKFDAAIPYLKKAIYELKADLKHKDVGPRCLQCYALILYKKKKDYTLCIEVLQQLMKHKEFNNIYKANKDEIYYLLSRVYSKSCDFPQSLKYLKKAKKFNPNRKIYQNQIKILKNAMIADIELN